MRSTGECDSDGMPGALKLDELRQHTRMPKMMISICISHTHTHILTYTHTHTHDADA